MRIGLLECDHVDEGLRTIAGDYGDMFERLLGDHAPSIDLEHHDIVGGAPLPSPESTDGWIITGSRHGVNDTDVAWIDDLLGFTQRADAAGTPIVGICFGHQVLAHAFGGEVQRAAQGWGVGVHDATVEVPTDWMTPDADRFALLVTHQDQVTRLPDGAVRVATSQHAPVAAYQQRRMLGFQGHPEFVRDYAEALLAARADRIGPPVVEAARATLERPTDHGTVARWMERFLQAPTG